jgi:hypothetical protein
MHTRRRTARAKLSRSCAAVMKAVAARFASEGADPVGSEISTEVGQLDEEEAMSAKDNRDWVRGSHV